MSSHNTVPDVYGPGTYADTSFIPLTQDCPRLLQWLARETPGFTTDSKLLESVNWKGNDLPLLPGPLKAHAFAAVLHAMAGIVGKEISASKDVDTGNISIDIDHAGMYPASASIVMINGRSPAEMIQDGTFFKIGTDLDKGEEEVRVQGIHAVSADRVYHSEPRRFEQKSLASPFLEHLSDQRSESLVPDHEQPGR